MKLAVLGYGYWGPNLVRNFCSIGKTIKYVADSSLAQRQKAEKAYPSVLTTPDTDTAIYDSDVDAVVIALPVGYHYEMAKKALLAGKHVLVEKPMTFTSAEADELIEIASRKNLVLMPDHTFLYTGAVRKIKELIDTGKLGDVLYFDSTRINLGLFQSDVSVLWDLAPHDISILSYLINDKPISVAATGKAHEKNGFENMAFLTMNYKSNYIAHTNVSWISPIKIRKVLLGGTKKMVVYDDLEPTEKVKVYDSGYKMTNIEEQNRFKVDYRVGDIHIPKLDMTEALTGVATDFTLAVESGGKHTPVSDMHLGASVVRTLEAAQRSLKNDGKAVKLS